MGPILITIALLLQGEPAKLELLAHKDTPPASFPGTAVVSVTVKNVGDLEAVEPIAVLTFYDAQSAPIRKVRAKLAMAIAVGAEDTFAISVAQCPSYASVRAAVIWRAANISGASDKLSEDPRIEVGECKLARFSDGSIRVRGKARNGENKGIEKLVITFKFGAVSHPAAIPGGLKPGTVRDFEAFVPDCPPFDGYTYSIASAPCDDPKEVPDEAAPKVERTAHKDAPPKKIVDPYEPDPPATKGTPPPPPAAGAYTVEVRNLAWVVGYTMKNKKYSGDVAFLQLLIKDGDGKPVKPTGKCVVTLAQGKNPKGTATRNIKVESWGTDASKIDNQNVSEQIISAHKQTGELWIGLVRADAFWLSLTIDITLTLDKVGVWEWKGLNPNDNGDYVAAPKGPDKPDKK